MPSCRQIEVSIRSLLQAFALIMLVVCIPQGTAHATCVGLGCYCTISTDPLDFGTYNPLGGTDISATGSLDVECGALLTGVAFSYTVTLDSGSSGTMLNRSMTSGPNTLNYNLYTNPSHTTVWGDGTGGTATISNAYTLTLLFPRTDNFPVYGRIPSGQNAHAGSYTDTIIATVIF